MKADTLALAKEEQRAPWSDVEIDTRDFTVFRDKYPVTEGHLLIVPKEATQENIMKCFNFAVTMGYDNVESDKTNITGYNIGLNVGVSAGQTVMYPHVHLIFRRDGDMEDPKGGVRGVIPSKQKY
jgi:ATP adenylyltransferase